MALKPSGDDEHPLTPEDEKQADKILNKSKKLNPKVRPKRKTDKEKQSEYKQVQNFLSQFLDAYTVVGFNTAGEEFVLMKYNNSLEGRGLANLVDEFFTRHFESLTSYSNSKKDDDDDDEDEDDD